MGFQVDRATNIVVWFCLKEVARRDLILQFWLNEVARRDLILQLWLKGIARWDSRLTELQK